MTNIVFCITCMIDETMELHNKKQSGGVIGDKKEWLE
jgi:hypothetical protein